MGPDSNMIQGYLGALREAKSAKTPQESLNAARKVAAHWFAMDVVTQKEAYTQAKAERLV